MIARTRYTDDKVNEALTRALYEPVEKISKDLNVAVSTIYRWRTAVQAGKRKFIPPSPTPPTLTLEPPCDATHKKEAERLRTTVDALKAEVANLKEQNVMLKKMFEYLIKDKQL